MKNYKIVVVGGSIAGLTSALVLASAISDDLKFDITVVDENNNKADLFKALPYNVPLFRQGIAPEDIIKEVKGQIAKLANVNYVTGKVANVSGSKGSFTLSGDGVNLQADYVVLATGATEFDIKGLGDIVQPHTLMNKPNKIKLKNDHFKVADGVYVAGLASGVTTMIGSAIGSATSSACALLSDIEGTVTVIHDSKGTRDF